MSETRVLTIDAHAPADAGIREAAAAIAAGKLVIIPTETVYGIACNQQNPAALARLRTLKKRPEDKPFSFLIAHKERVDDFCADIPVKAYRLMRDFWPGPLTLVLKAKGEGTIGLRMPDHAVAQRIVAQSEVPVVCPSANLADQEPPVHFSDSLRNLDGLVDLAVDSGDCRMGTESTVVEIVGDQYRILREGALDIGTLSEALSKKTVLFICTGNSCRSVMAEALLAYALKQRNRTDVEVMSAGIMMMSGLGASEPTRMLLAHEGIDVSKHRSKRVDRELIMTADLILVMEKIHEEKILQIAPEAKNRVFLLKEFAKIDVNQLDIEDPIGMSFEYYGKVYDVIKQAVNHIAEII